MNAVASARAARTILSRLNLTVTLTRTVAKGSAPAKVISIAAASFPARPNDDRFDKDAKVRVRQRLLVLAGTDVLNVAFADPKSDDLIGGLEGQPWRVISNWPFRPDGVTVIYHETVVQG